MQHTHKVLAGLTTAVLLLPAAASAQASASLEMQVKSLMSQIQSLQMQLKTLIGSSSPMIRVEKKEMQGPEHMNPGQMGKMMCVTLNRNLRAGAQGDDVKKLQEMLAQDPENEFRGKATGFFGPLTANAMAKFQMRAGIASTTDGTVGPMTRGFFERACGKGLDGGMGGGMGQGVGGMMDMRAEIGGTISAVSGSSITVQGKDNTMSRTVNVTASTTIHMIATPGAAPTIGTMADLTVGKMVRVEGIPQLNGVINARQIKVGAMQ